MPQGVYAASISACPALTSTPKVAGSVDGLGTLGFYTFVKQNLDDRLQLETNVANGNVVAQYNALQIHGTGLDLAIQFTYNAQSTTSGVLGNNWNLSVGNGVSLSFNGANATLHGSSGFQATYQADSSSFGGFDEPPGLDATLLSSTVNGAAHVLIFQKTSECFGFNSQGQEIFDQDKNGHQITFAYNSAGHVSSITDTQNRLTSFSYDSSGRISTITDPINRTIQLNYGSNNNVSSLVDLNGKTTSFAYSGHLLTFGTLQKATDGNGHVTTYSYDSKGNLISVTPPSPLGAETLTVDGVSRVSSETDGNGITTSFTYDRLDRLTKLAYTGGATISYTHDGNGNLLTVVDNTGTTTFTYDKDNRQLTKTLPAGKIGRAHV